MKNLMFRVINYMVITVDHCTFPFDRVLPPIDRYRFELTQLVTEIPLFVHPV